MSCDRIKNIVSEIAQELSIEEAVLMAIIKTESDCNPLAYNKYTNAMGLMQITPVALKHVVQLSGKEVRLDDLYEPRTNIWVGAFYLKWLKFYFDRKFSGISTWHLTFMAYNWGIGNVVKWLNMEKPNHAKVINIPQETKDYLVKFDFWYNYYKKQQKSV
jgi:soluble lytic murein transglycosylase